MKKINLIILFLCIAGGNVWSQSDGKDYLIPDIGTPGMATKIEIISKYIAFSPDPLVPNYFMNTASFYNGSSGILMNNVGDQLRLICKNPQDDWKLTFGPLSINWLGQCITTHVFVNKDLEPNSYDWEELDSIFRIPLALKTGNDTVLIDTFYVLQAWPALNSSSVITNIGSGSIGTGKRSPRGAMLFEDVNLSGTGQPYKISTNDCDPYLEGNQGYLPVHLFSMHSITIANGSVLSLDANAINAGPGGGGGGAGSINGDSGNGFTAGGYSCTPNASNPFTIWNQSGQSTGHIIPSPESNNEALRGSFSLNGIPGGFGRCDQGGGGGTGHPLGASGAYGATYAASADPHAFPGMYGGGSAGGEINLAPDSTNMPFGGGGGGNGTIGEMGEANYNSNGGRITGNQYLVPLGGGSGGGAGNVWALYQGGNGGGGGGAIHLFAYEQSNISKISAKGGHGSNGYVPYASQVGIKGASGGGGGSGGSVIISSKGANTGLNMVDLSGGEKGLGDQQDTIISHDGGKGGAGRLRIDGAYTDFTMLSDSGSFASGPTSDTSHLVESQFLLTGTANGNPVKIFSKPEGGNWSLLSTISGYTDSTWSGLITLNSNVDFHYLVIAQQSPAPNMDTMVWEPEYVFSQAAWNYIEINRAPDASNDSVAVFENDSVLVNVLLNDYDYNGNTLFANVLNGPAHGIFQMQDSANIFYSPFPGYFGSDTISFLICDGLLCDTSFLFIDVLEENLPPVTTSDYYQTNEDSPLALYPLLNDSDPDPQDILVITDILQLPGSGNIQQLSDSVLLYTPNENFNGNDFLVYKVCNNSFFFPCSSDTIFIEVDPVNDAPSALDGNQNPTDSLYYTVNEDDSITICLDFLDVENDQVALSNILSSGSGNVSINTQSNCLDYIPQAQFNGPDSISIEFCDDGVPQECNSVTVWIDVSPVNDPPLILDGNGQQTDTLFVELPENSLANVCLELFDVDNDSVYVTSLEFIPANGNGTLENNNPFDSCFTYVPDSGFDGNDTALVVCSDGTASDTIIIVFSVLPENIPPLVLDAFNQPSDSFLVQIDEDNSIQLCFEFYDENLDSVFISDLGSLTGNGTLLDLNPLDTCLTYIPNENFNGMDSAFFIICDDGIPSACDTIYLYFDVQPVNDPPVNNMSDTIYLTTMEDTELEICFDIYDPDFDSFTIFSGISTETNHGLIIQTSDPLDTCISYFPDLNYSGYDSVWIDVCDNNNPSYCVNYLVIINVQNQNDPPVADAVSITTFLDNPVSFSLINHVYDNDNDSLDLEFYLEKDGNHGTINYPSSDGNWEYWPEPGYIGQDTVLYKVCDLQSCDISYITINIEYDLFFPNAISPNDDGKNDYFQIIGLENYVDEFGVPYPNTFRIFNRWGTLVFHVADYSNDDKQKRWNGTSNISLRSIIEDMKLPDGTYFYEFSIPYLKIRKTSYVILKK